MHRESVERSGARRPIVVGDRLDTDIEGARRVGCPSLLVLTGVTTPVEVITATPELRPDFVAADLGGLLHPHPEAVVDGAEAVCGSWRAVADGNTLHLSRRGDDPDPVDDLDPLRVLIVAAWTATDSGAQERSSWRFAGGDAAARDALGRFDLD
jgi:hypothetical protein